MFDAITEFIAYLRLFILIILSTDSILIINLIVSCQVLKQLKGGKHEKIEDRKIADT